MFEEHGASEFRARNLRVCSESQSTILKEKKMMGYSRSFLCKNVCSESLIKQVRFLQACHKPVILLK